ncbi:solute carrier family 35 member D3 [Hyalella azteca]|uniref:Solute carrier family 35 member D3 n=1 Tax=Hyalella azteca TaxID=294128 RepID=A0A8B7N7G9_HYAAZ|nr:solute carrier family 35 member D3 [Hyalella azteca]
MATPVDGGAGGGTGGGRRRELMAVLFFFVTSLTITFINKAVVFSFNFNLPFLIMTMQMALMVTSLWTLSMCEVVSLPPYTLAAGWAFKWPSLCYVMHGVFSFYAIAGLNIPMYGALRRFIPIITLLLTVVMLKKGFPSCLITSSIFLITAGCVVAGAGDLTYDTFAYLFGLLSALAQALANSLVQYHTEQEKLSPSRILQLNSHNVLLPAVVLSLAVGEPYKALSNPYWKGLVMNTTGGIMFSCGKYRERSKAAMSKNDILNDQNLDQVLSAPSAMISSGSRTSSKASLISENLEEGRL